MKERTFNIFMYVNGTDRTIREIGVVEHQQEGTEDEKQSFLQSRVDQDYESAPRFPMPKFCYIVWSDGQRESGVIRWDLFCELETRGQHMHVFEPIFAELKAPIMPLMVITPIVDGKPKIEGFIQLDPFRGT